MVVSRKLHDAGFGSRRRQLQSADRIVGIVGLEPSPDGYPKPCRDSGDRPTDRTEPGMAFADIMKQCSYRQIGSGRAGAFDRPGTIEGVPLIGIILSTEDLE